MEPILNQILTYIYHKIYLYASDGIYQRILQYKMYNIIYGSSYNIKFLVKLIEIGDMQIISDIIDRYEIVDLIGLISEDEYMLDDDVSLIDQIDKLLHHQNIQLFGKCVGCNMMRISDDKTECKSCGYIQL
jgi:hypothetical protein